MKTQQIFNALTYEPQTMRQLMTRAGLTDTYYNFLNAQARKGLCVKEGNKYALPPAAEAQPQQPLTLASLGLGQAA